MSNKPTITVCFNLDEYIVDSFSVLRELCEDLIKIGENPFRYSSISDYCLCSGNFTVSTLQNNCWIWNSEAIRAGDGEVGPVEQMEENDYIQCEITDDWFHMNDFTYVHFLDQYVSTEYVDHSTSWYYSEIDSEWYRSYDQTPECEQEEEEEDRYTDRYHSRPSYRHSGSSGIAISYPFFIGIEFEKEDRSVKESITISDFNDATNHEWRKEEDGSLDSYSGFELISPIFHFDIPYIINHITSNDVLLDHINADSSSNCGGHINLSSSKMSVDDLYDQVKWYLPLLYAMYPKRKENTFCKAKTIDKIKLDKAKYSSIYIKSQCIEFRIFPQIKNIDQLTFRLKLIRMMCENQVSDFAHMLQVIIDYKDLFLSVYDDKKFSIMFDRLQMEIAIELNEQQLQNELTSYQLTND